MSGEGTKMDEAKIWDWYASFALMGLCVVTDRALSINVNRIDIAKQASALADHMMRERSTRYGED